MSQVSQAVRNAVIARLSAGANGFNGNLDATLQSYGLDPSEIFWEGIDWNGSSGDFFKGRLAPDLLEETSKISYPALAIDTIRSANTNRVKFAQFSGLVTLIIDFHLSWGDSESIPNFADYADAVEDAMYKTLLDQEYQAWPMTILFGGNAVLQKGGVALGGYNWRQTLTFTLQFEVNTN